MRRAGLAVLGMMMVAIAMSSCGSATTTTATSRSSGRPAASPSPSAAGDDIDALVETFAAQIAAELGQAPDSVSLSSNPYDYLDYCPTYRRVVTLGPSALPAIAHYILDNKAYGLDGYVLAIAGEKIWGSHGTPPAPGAKSWDNSGQWARQYLAWAKDHPPND
jgi:hypothetical protein